MQKSKRPFVWTIGTDLRDRSTPLVWDPGFFMTEKYMKAWQIENNWHFTDFGICVPDRNGDFHPERQYAGEVFKRITFGHIEEPLHSNADRWLTLLGDPA